VENHEDEIIPKVDCVHFCADTITLTRSGVNGELLVLVLHEHINPTQLEMLFRGVGLIILQLLTQHKTFIMRNDVYFLATLRSTTSAERFAYGDACGKITLHMVMHIGYILHIGYMLHMGLHIEVYCAYCDAYWGILCTW